jgi:hypothetical protein
MNRIESNRIERDPEVGMLVCPKQRSKREA